MRKSRLFNYKKHAKLREILQGFNELSFTFRCQLNGRWYQSSSKKKKKMFLNVCKGIGFAVNTRKKELHESWKSPNVVGNERITIGSSSYENVEIFTYLDSILTSQNYIYDEIKCGINAGNSCYYLLQILMLDFSLRIRKIKIYK